MREKFRSGLLLAASTAMLLSLSNGASATIWTHSCPGGDIGQASCPKDKDGGNLLAAEFTFDDVTQDFSWSGTVAPYDAMLPEATWFVITPSGLEPKHAPNSVAILYFDFLSRDGAAYAYVQSSPDEHRIPGEKDKSWKNDTQNNSPDAEVDGFIASYVDAVTSSVDGDGNLDFTIAFNTAILNGTIPDVQLRDGKPWRGLSFGDDPDGDGLSPFGVWAALFTNDESDSLLSFDSNGRIVSFLGDNDLRTSYDRDGRLSVHLPPPQIPEPATLPLVAVGLLLVALARRLHYGRLPAPLR